MYDNGLLEYYRSLKSRDGFLDVTPLGVTKNYFFTQKNVAHEQIDGKPFYVKTSSPTHCFSKQTCDAEILLSQIYNKAGIPSAVYLPVCNTHASFLLSNDVEKPDTVIASSHLIDKLAGLGTIALPFLAQKDEIRVNPAKIYTTYAMQQQTKMRVLDAASYNYDRHSSNFFFKLHHAPFSAQSITLQKLDGQSSPVTQLVKGMGPNKVQDVVAIDFGVSGSVIGELEKNPYADMFNIYSSDFATFSEPREKIIEEIQTNEKFAALMDKDALAETIGSLDPSAVATDIKETTGYQVDTKMVDILAKSYDDMAEILLQ